MYFSDNRFAIQELTNNCERGDVQSDPAEGRVTGPSIGHSFTQTVTLTV